MEILPPVLVVLLVFTLEILVLKLTTKLSKTSLKIVVKSKKSIGLTTKKEDFLELDFWNLQVLKLHKRL